MEGLFPILIVFTTTGSEVVFDLIAPNSAYVIERSFTFTFTLLIINDMKRIYGKIFKSKKPSLGSLHGPGPLTAPSTLTSSGTTGLGLMPSIPSFDSDGTASAGVSVRV